MEPSKNSPLTVPIAIVVAGLLIAGAVFFSRSGGTFSLTDTSTSRGPSALAELLKGAPTDDAKPQNIVASLESIPALQPETDHLLGNPNAPVIIIEYSDLECPFCRIFHQTLRRIIDENGKSGRVAWVYRHFPLIQLHSKASKEAEATECAAELGGNLAFWKFTDRIFEITPSNDGLDLTQLSKIAEFAELNVTAFNQCLESGRHTADVQRGYNEAVGAGGNGTPFSIIDLQKPLSTEGAQEILPLFDRYRDPNTGLPPIKISPDGMRISLSGAMPYEVMNSIIEILLK
ncbi:MAG: hypothetical protein COV91_04545 [Candidatus Taylorbacteria bacterium CG11_big_fil_rev_8_21_14_0_20_46_11]|uniref:Thioredoxin-like fold domain-containing protein n=1 Tax=Candidatus Taylorbacteria bacterium CG11_big_fil_rev_8_21_14_0_20_46_11 TaxID=1975025 RepID=A0A2H0KAY3_9BACT|nr:MAG: hypothetical protein COV91_04545 [Candidatus Taylorbacteria bacterium CG11_big_fil_rev_8_21_14_0_20_46_11]